MSVRGEQMGQSYRSEAHGQWSKRQAAHIPAVQLCDASEA